MILGIVGAFGDSNFGDYAMLVNNIYSIEPSQSIIFTYNEALLDNLTKTYLKGYMLSSVNVKTSYVYKAAYGNSYDVQYDDEMLIPTQVLNYICNEQEVRNAIQKISALFVCGGGYFNHVWNARHRKSKLLSMLGVILIAREEHKKIVFGGNTFGPFDASAEFFKSILLPLQNVIYAVRDDVYSVANLRQLGIGNDITLLPDDLYFLHNQFHKYIPHIEISLPERYMIMELYSPLDEIESKYSEIESFIYSMEFKYGLKVVFVSLDKGFGGEEQGARLESIHKLMIWHFGNQPYRKVEDVLYIVRRAQFVLCQRYHLFLFAIANNIPAYQLLKDVCGDKRYYYAKSGGLLKQVFQNQIYRESLFFAHDIVDGFREIIEHYQTLIYEQKNLFNQKKRDAEIEMKQNRLDYIRTHINYVAS
nr:polysaccharide pyruvyl transferase family protein [uncultured Acetatifactor sp.]